MDYFLEDLKKQIDATKSLMGDFFEAAMESEFPLLEKQEKGKVKRNFAKKMLIAVFQRYNAEILAREIQIHPSHRVTPEIMLNYIYHYHLFSTNHLLDDERAKLQKNDLYQEKLINDVAMEILFKEHHNVVLNSTSSYYSPEICRYEMLVNFLLIHVSQITLSMVKDKRTSGCRVLITKALRQMKSMLLLLSNGLESDAIIIWRSLFELECILAILYSHEVGVADEYYEFRKFMSLSHLDENTEYYKTINKELQDKMELCGVNKKNRTKFINYGWLMLTKEVSEEKCSLDFKNGLCKIAGLERKYMAYQSACKISHPSAITTSYSNKDMYTFAINQLHDSLGTIRQYLENLIEELNIDFDKPNYDTELAVYTNWIEESSKIIHKKYSGE